MKRKGVIMDTVSIVLSVPAIVAIVNLVKKLGLDGRWAALAAVVIAIALNIGNYYLSTSGAWQAGLEGLLLGLAAAGLYDIAKAASGLQT